MKYYSFHDRIFCFVLGFFFGGKGVLQGQREREGERGERGREREGMRELEEDKTGVLLKCFPFLCGLWLYFIALAHVSAKPLGLCGLRGNWQAQKDQK